MNLALCQCNYSQTEHLRAQSTRPNACAFNLSPYFYTSRIFKELSTTAFLSQRTETIRPNRSVLWFLSTTKLVELTGIEPVTPSLQS